MLLGAFYLPYMQDLMLLQKIVFSTERRKKRIRVLNVSLNV